MIHRVNSLVPSALGHSNFVKETSFLSWLASDTVDSIACSATETGAPTGETLRPRQSAQL